MNEKAEKPTENKYLFIVNEKMWADIQKTLSDFLSAWKVNNTFMWSKSKNDYVDVGATFQSYVFGGNQISFKVDRTFTHEFGTAKGYGLCLDMTADSSGEPAIQLFSLKGGDFITSKYPGVGGLDGLTSGIVSSPVAGSKIIN